jgi:hypothetical protein
VDLLVFLGTLAAKAVSNFGIEALTKCAGVDKLAVSITRVYGPLHSVCHWRTEVVMGGETRPNDLGSILKEFWCYEYFPTESTIDWYY